MSDCLSQGDLDMHFIDENDQLKELMRKEIIEERKYCSVGFVQDNAANDKSSLFDQSEVNESEYESADVKFRHRVMQIDEIPDSSIRTIREKLRVPEPASLKDFDDYNACIKLLQSGIEAIKYDYTSGKPTPTRLWLSKDLNTLYHRSS